MAFWLSTVLLAMVVVAATAGTKHPDPKLKSVKCYQCAYSPGKTVYEEEKFPIERDVYVKHGKYHKKVKTTFYETRKVPITKPGGWDKCNGSFTHEEAKEYGIDVWECHDNCYARKEDNGNIFRGCYKEEWGVDPSKTGECGDQAGSYYCFCEGDLCNNGDFGDGHGVGR